MSGERRCAHLVLSGGGVRCISFVGALEELEKTHTWASISSCSAGTLLAVMRAMGMSPAAMRDAIMTYDMSWPPELRSWRLVRSMAGMMRPPFALIRRPLLPDVLRALVPPNLASQTMEQLQIPVAAAAIDVAARQLVVYTSKTHPEMAVTELLAYTAALPPLSPPMFVDGSELVDASFSWATPIWLTAAFEQRLPTVVVRARRAHRPPTGLRRLLGRSARIRVAGLDSHDTFVIAATPDVSVYDIVSPVGPVDRMSRAQRAALMDLGRATVAQRDEQVLEGAIGKALNANHLFSTDLYRQHHERVGSVPPRTVFVSYAREDRSWVDRITFHLRRLIADPSVSVWSDHYLTPGARWDPMVKFAIERARVAIVIVSAHSIASDYISTTEIPLLVERARSGRTVLFWLSIDGTEPPVDLNAYQTAAPSDSPLNCLPAAQVEQHLANLSRDIEDVLARDVPANS